MSALGHNRPLQATRCSGHLVFNRQARRAPERERWASTLPRRGIMAYGI